MVGAERSTLIIILVLVLIALIFMFIILRRRRRGTYRLERDPTGLWRYHKETQFHKHVAFGHKIDENGTEDEPLRPIAVIHFGGDIRARGHKTLADLVDEVEVNKGELSEVVVVITSPGGMVPQYGHAFSQIERIRNLELKLTVCIDVVAASGGYLMALPAHKIIAAPFAMVGSVGVMAFVPNVRRLLTNLHINPRTFTSGKYKRTVSLTDEAGPEEIVRFKQQLETIHQMFLAAVKKYRGGSAKLEEIETGEHWTAQESIEKGLGLVDELMTSHEYLLKRNRQTDLIHFVQKRNIWEEGLGWFGGAVERAVMRFVNPRRWLLDS